MKPNDSLKLANLDNIAATIATGQKYFFDAMQQKIPHDCMFYESVMAHSSRFLSRAENVTRGGLDGLNR